jgi:hypothetical protein
MQKELPNDRANRRLVGGEWRWVLPQHWGRNGDGEGSFDWLFLLIGRGEREGVVLVPRVGDGRPLACRFDGTTVRRRVPCSMTPMCGPL